MLKTLVVTINKTTVCLEASPQTDPRSNQLQNTLCGPHYAIHKSILFPQKEKLATPVNLRPAGWTGLGPTPISTSGPSPQYPPSPPSPLPMSPMSAAKSWKGSMGLRGTTIGDSSSVADTSDLMAYSTLKSQQDVAEKPVTMNHQDWSGFSSKEETEGDSKTSTSWMEALKEVREKSREKKR